jgi:hypothetical protein
VLFASFATFLVHNSYPLVTKEVGVSLVALFAAAGAMGLLYQFVGNFVRRLFEALLVYLAIELNFDLGIAGLLIAAAAPVVLRRYLMPGIGVVFSAVLIGQLVGAATGADQSARASTTPPATTTPASRLPVLVHVVLDEHIGMQGLPVDQPGTAAMRQELGAFYQRHGFRLFGGAYSEHMHTINALPYLLNFGKEQPWVPGSKQTGVTLQSNAYFDALRGLGYAINVYQTDFVDYCTGGQVRSCTTINGSALGPLSRTGLSAAEKAAVMLSSFWSLSDGAAMATKVYDALAVAVSPHLGTELPRIDLDLYRRTSTAGAVEMADRVIADLQQAKPGEAYFAHLLLPHYPYSANRDCTIKPLAEWGKRRSLRLSLSVRHQAYFDQIGCVLKKVDAIVQALAGKDSIIVLHGDHGSRITTYDPSVENAGRFDEHDLVAGYSTLFAVHAPSLAGGYDATPAPVAGLLASLATSGFTAVDVGAAFVAAPSVVLENGEWQPVERHALPADWLRH